MSFLLSAFLFAGMAVLAYTGFLGEIEGRFYNSSVAEALIRGTAGNAYGAVQILALVAIFVTMFLIVFFFFNVKQRSPAAMADRQGFTVVRESEVTDVIFERDGIPYISNSAFNDDNNAEEKLDNNFVNLIESVVNRKLSPPAPRN